eukprot:CAMPEP_0172741316 /NCGR_PEP_ID=MMETSP1074-20121228/126950_1 /TAXON_ID=2916 /ORGANISM="Ceratium fusus, Strain PA161109" /LENGTH=70 /DNA_ID=CAMNT_0013571601 /DNA_START=183 /DNA_END=392 /DNA_ORIENTATION=-
MGSMISSGLQMSPSQRDDCVHVDASCLEAQITCAENTQHVTQPTLASFRDQLQSTPHSLDTYFMEERGSM